MLVIRSNQIFHPSQQSIATAKRPNHPGCFAFVAIKTRAEHTNIEYAIKFVMKWLFVSTVEYDSHNNNPPSVQPKIVTICQDAHRILIFLSFSSGFPIVGTTVPFRRCLKIKNSPKIEWINPTISEIMPAENNSMFIFLMTCLTPLKQARVSASE